MAKVPRRTLRLTLALVTAWGLLPALLALQWTALRYREDALDQKKEILGSMAGLAAVGLQGLVVQVETLLLSLSQTPQVLGGDAACRSFLQSIHDKTPEFVGLGVTDAKGRMLCSSGAAPTARNDDYLIRAMRDRVFSIGEYAVSETGRAPDIGFAYPLLGPDGTVRGAIYARLGLRAMDAVAAELRLPEEVRMAVVDRRAIVLAGNAPQRFATGTLADRRLLADQESAPGAPAGGGGTGASGAGEWYAATAAVPGLQRGDLRVVVESSRAEEVAAIYRGMRRALITLLLVLPLFVGFVWTRFRRHLFVPLEELVATARGIAGGNLDARASIDATSVEMHELGVAMNRMAQTQAERIRELERAEATMRAVLGSLGEGVIVADANEKTLLCNPAAERLLDLAGGRGLSPGSGADLCDCSGAALPEVLSAQLLRATRGEPLDGLEFELERPDGSSARQLQLTARPICGNDGGLRGGVVSLRDITVESQARALLQASEARLREAQRLARLWTWELDARRRRLVLPAELRNLLGAGPAGTQDAYRLIARFVPQAERRPLLRVARLAMAQGKVLDFEHSLKGAGGEMRTVLLRAEPRVDSAGAIIGLAGFTQDVTEQRALERERVAHAEQLRRLADACLFISTRRTISETVGELTRRAREITGAACCRMVLVGLPEHSAPDGAADIEYRAASGPAPGFAAAGQVHGIMRGARGTVGLRGDERLAGGFGLGDTGAGQGWLAAPLMAPGGDYLGFVELLDKEAGDFGENDAAMLAQLAQLATIAIVNAGLLRRLQKTETRYRELFEHSVEGLFQAGADGRLVLVNLAFANMLNYDSPEDMLSRNASVLLDARAIGLRELDHKLFEKGALRGIEMMLPRSDGTELWASIGLRLVRNEDGGVLGFEGTVKDVTARREAEEALRELNSELESRIEQRTRELAQREALYRTLTELSPQIIWRADSRGRITYLNRAWSEMSGCSVAESLGMNWLALVHPDDVVPMTGLWKQASATLQQVRCEVRFRTRSGRYSTFYCVAVPIHPDGAAPHEWVGINADISAHKQATEALELSNRELEAFSYSVSHDLRAPLHTIEGFSQALLMHYGSSLEGKARHYVERINHGARTMASLIEHLLGLARVTRTRLERSQVDFSALARQTLANLREQEPGRVVETVIREGLIASGSPQLLGLALSNLLENAWKYTRTTAAARIEFDVKPSARGAVFVVRDNGIGFDMRYADKLFVPFQRLHTQSEFPGSGVGLAIVKRVIQRHHGDIWVESAPGAGASFFFSLWVREL